MRAGAAGMLPLLAGLVLPSPAGAERLVMSLSTHRVLISSNFTGVDLALFGSVEMDAGSVGRAGGYGIAVTVTGPRTSVMTWRKERVFGLWVNASSRTFVEPPSYYAVLTSKPIDQLAPPDRLRRYQIGLGQILLPQKLEGDIGDVAASDPFRQAFIELKRNAGLYLEQPNTVTFLTPTLFRSVIRLPANVPVGDYEVELKLFADGAIIAREGTAFEIVKVGFERLIAQGARDHGLLYGLATVALAFLTGWLGSIVFRRD